MAAVGLKHFSSDSRCKLLSVFTAWAGVCPLAARASSASSRASSGAPETPRVQCVKGIGFFIFLRLVLCTPVNTVLPMYVTATLSDKSTANNKDFAYCSAVRHGKTRDPDAALLFLPDVLFWGSRSGPAAPWCSSCNRTSSVSTTVMGLMSPPEPLLSPEPHRAPSSLFTSSPPSFKFVLLFF